MMKRLCATLLMLAWGLSALAGGKSETIVYINGAKYYVHTVKAVAPKGYGSIESAVRTQVAVHNKIRPVMEIERCSGCQRKRIALRHM